MNDYTVFASPDFDANEYANAILAGEQYPPQQPGKANQIIQPAQEDISVAISKLNTGIDDVSKQIKNVVTTHHVALLEQAAGVSDLSSSLSSVRGGISDLEGSLEKLRSKIRVPYQSLQLQVSRLQKLQHVSDVLRRTSRFVILARRLEVQMLDIDDSNGTSTTKSQDTNSTRTGIQGQGHTLEPEDEKERTIAKAALTVAELVALIDVPGDTLQHAIDLDNQGKGDAKAAHAGIPLKQINVIAAQIPFIEESRAKITAEMESMVLTGLTTLNQSLLASSLQTAYNLHVLPELVQSLVQDLSEAVEERIHSAFDLSRISKEALSKDSQLTAPGLIYKSRVRTEPTNVTAPQFTATLWARLENLVEEMAACCIKVYTLEKVLKLKRDTTSQTIFLDEAMKLLENKPSSTFWTALALSLERNARDAAKASSFLQQTLSTGYPRLLRLFHDFFAKIAVHTDTVYTQTQQSPETILILRALSNFEALYLSRSSNRMNETVGQAFSGGTRAPPGMNEGVNISRAVANELDSAKFDPLLVNAVCKGSVESLNMMVSRADSLIARDRSAVSMVGPTATPQQALNGQVASCLFHCRDRLVKLKDECPESVMAVLQPSIESINATYIHITEPLMSAIRRELGATIARLHRIDFGKSMDPMAGMGGSSLYMKDLAEKLSFIKAEILNKFNIGDDGRKWVLSIVSFVIKTFVLHVSIAKPLGESGKLQLTSDMTELEFALSAFMVENPQSKRGGNLELVGDDYRALRAMRPLLFLDNAQLASPKHTVGLPPLIVLHHILVRSPIPLPHTLHGWQEAEYVRWLEEHTEAEAWTLVESDLSHWEKVDGASGEVGEEAQEYVQLARSVLVNAANP